MRRQRLTSTASGRTMTSNVLGAICAAEKAYAAIPYTETGNNHQRFSDVVNAAGLAGYQNAAWCATYQFAVELETVGKDQALKNWNMTASNYCGYSVFETESAFARAGKTGLTPKPGALVIFRQSHMGRVLAVDGDVFSCGEGNTSNAQFHRDGDACAVKTYKVNDPKIKSFCYIDYPVRELTPNDIINSTKNVYQIAHNGRYRYGDSHANPPCSDGVISCDRLPALALYNLGFTDQPKGSATTSSGITVLNMESYLLKWGFKKITSPNLRPGDIVLMKWSGTTQPTAKWHAYVVTAVNGSLISKYDMGEQWRIDAVQPFKNVPINEWGGNRQFYAAFRISKQEYTFTPKDVVQGSTGASQYLANEILKAYDLKGLIKDGKAQSLELNDRWTNGDMAAMCNWKLDRIRHGDANLCKGTYGAGEVGRKDWTSLLSSGLPFVCRELPTKETHGASVLLCQRIMKAHGYVGANGKPLSLDADWGKNTEHAVREYQKARGLEVTGVVDYNMWQKMIAI